MCLLSRNVPSSLASVIRRGTQQPEHRVHGLGKAIDIL